MKIQKTLKQIRTEMLAEVEFKIEEMRRAEMVESEELKNSEKAATKLAGAMAGEIAHELKLKVTEFTDGQKTEIRESLTKVFSKFKKLETTKKPKVKKFGTAGKVDLELGGA